MTFKDKKYVNRVGTIFPTTQSNSSHYYPYPMYTYNYTDNQYELKPATVNESTQTVSLNQLKKEAKRYDDEKMIQNLQGKSVIEEIQSEKFPLKYTIAHFGLLFLCSFILIIIQMGLNFKGVKYANVYSGYWVIFLNFQKTIFFNFFKGWWL